MDKDELMRRTVVITGDFTLKSGQSSNSYIDMRALLSRPDLLHSVAESMRENIDPESTIIGVPMGGAFLACYMASHLHLPFSFWRDAPKDYGLQRQLEGDTQCKSFTLVEDVVTTGQSTLKFIDSLGPYAQKIDKIIVLLDREQGGVQALRDAGYDVVTYITMDELTTGSYGCM